MKRFVICALIIGLVFGASGSIRAEDSEIKVLVNGKAVVSDAPAMNVEGSVMLPFRAILNAIGVADSEIEWDDKSKTMEIKHNKKYVFLAIGNRGVVVDQSMTMLNTAPMINQGRTMIPVRMVEAFGASVQWDGNTNTVTIKTK
ncbi:MAG: copper amine oxidase N-terminal domain-containing protein [Syntrophomonas sp.]